MTRVIRSKTGRYLKKDGAWTTDFPDAEKFGNLDSVLSAHKRHQLQQIDLVLVIFEQPSSEWDVVLPLSDRLTLKTR